MESFEGSALKRLILEVVREVGFDSISSRALSEMERLVLQYVAGVLYFSKELSQDCRRSQPNTVDLIRGIAKTGLTIQELHAFHLKQHNKGISPVRLTYAAPLPAEQPLVLPYVPTREEAEARLDIQPHFFPVLPPQHSWKQTPVFPQGMVPRQGPLGDLTFAETDNRVKVTRMVESSLRALIRNTNAALSAAPLAKAVAEEQVIPIEEDERLEHGPSEPVQAALDTLNPLPAFDAPFNMDLGMNMDFGLGGFNSLSDPNATSAGGMLQDDGLLDPFLFAMPDLQEEPEERPVPRVKVTFKNRDSAKEALVNLQLLASTNADESLDATIVNWQTALKKRGVAAVDTNGISSGRGRKIKWTL